MTTHSISLSRRNSTGSREVRVERSTSTTPTLKESVFFSRTTDRRGFTLVELLVVIAIIGILIGLLLPAIQAARATARRMQCVNNIKQLSLSVLNYENAKHHLPVGAYSCCWGTWLAYILPYIEEPGLARQYSYMGKYDIPDTSYRYSAARNLSVTKQWLTVGICPDDVFNRTTLRGFTDITSHSYVVNMGNTGFDVSGLSTTPADNLNGISYLAGPFSMQGGPNDPSRLVKLKDIYDGTSRTMMFSECIIGRGDDLRGFSWWGYAAGFETNLAPNSTAPDAMQSSSYCVNTPPNPPCIGSQPMTMAARSRHRGGVNASMCDGSVRWFSNDVDILAWRALSTMKGRDSVKNALQY